MRILLAEDFYPFYVVAAVVLVVFLVDWIRRSTKTKRIRRYDFPLKWLKHLETRVPAYQRLPFDLKPELQDLLRMFIGDKVFRGAGDMDRVPEEVQVMIAANACLPLLSRGNDMYRFMRTVKVYPVEHIHSIDPDLWRFEQESWSESTAVYSWDEASKELRTIKEVGSAEVQSVVRELSGKKEGESSEPYLVYVWAKVLAAEYFAERGSAEALPTLDAQGDESGKTMAFSMASEFFFEQPGELSGKREPLYAALRAFYKLDPARWKS